MTLADQLRRDEGVKLSAYQDSLGYWTIGVGRLIDARRGGGISQEEADFLLANDIKNVTNALYGHMPWTIDLDPVRLAVLQNVAFNVGIAGLLGFHQTLAKVQSGDYAGAADDMLASKWATQVGARAERLAQQMRDGGEIV